MPLVLRPPGDAIALPERLAALGRARRRAAVLGGLCRVAALGLFLLTVVGGLDYAVHLPGAVRALFLAGILGGVGVAFRNWVRLPARESVHPLAVALRLEDRFPRLNDNLASAVDFLHTDRPAPLNRFQRVAVRRAETLAERYDLDAIVPRGRAWRGFWLSALAVAVVSTLTILDAPRVGRALVRLADPYGPHLWPTRTHIQLLEPAGFPTRLARGEAFPLRFTVAGVVPEKATVSVRHPGSPPIDESVAVPDGAVVDVRLDGAKVASDFEVRVTANDADTGWLPVVVAPAPKLVPLDGRASPQVRLVYPAYTDLPPAVLPDGSAVVEAVAGTRVEFRAAADRRIVAAAFRNQADPSAVLTATAAACVSSTNPFSALAAQLLADGTTADVPVRVSGPDGTRLEAEFTPRLPGLYALRFTDDTGLTGTRLFDFRFFPDPAPAVVLDRPAVGKDPLLLLPTATLPVAARAEDRPYAVKDLFLEYRVGGPDVPFRRLPLADAEAAGKLLPAVVGVPPVQPKPVSLDAVRRLPLAAFRKPDGSPPADGDVITLRAAAFDWDDRTALKEPGRSKDVDVRVLAKPSLEAQFQKELAGMRPDLLRLKEEQRQAREKTDEAAKTLDGGQVAEAGRMQRGVRNKVADPADGLRAKADQLRQTARANGLPRSPTTDKVEAVADDLDRLADQHLESADPLLDSARQEAERPKPDAKKLADQLGKAGTHQKAAEEGLAHLLERLEQWGGAGEVRGEARTLKDQLDRTATQADKAAERAPAGKPADQLTADQKAGLVGPSDKLDQLADQADGLLGKAARLAAEKDAQAAAQRAAADAKRAEAAKEPKGSPAADQLTAEAEGLQASADRAAAEAEALRKAVREAGGQAVADDLRAAADHLRGNRPEESAARRQAAADRLDKLTDPLVEKPAVSPEELQKKQATAGQEIDKLTAAQDELRKKVKAAAAEPDPEKRAAELKKLAGQQEELRREAEKLAERLTRDRAEPQAESLRRAAEQMDAARADLEQGRPPEAKQEEALDRLDEALGKLDADRQQAKEQLSREQREQLADQLKALRDRQAAAVTEADRVQAEALKAKKWGRGLLASVGDLEDREKNLAEELRAFAGKQLEELPVFNRLALQSADAMDRAAKAARDRADATDPLDPFNPSLEADAGERVARPMRTALRRLDQVLDSLKEDPKPKAAAGGPAPADGGTGGGDMPTGAAGVPPLAQLKALRAVQAELNERTAAFAKAHPDAMKLTDDERDELKELENSQRDVAELFEKLAPAFRPAPEAP